MKAMKQRIFLIALAFVAGSVIACKSSGNKDDISPDVVNNPITANGENKGDLPVFQFETDVHDFGKVIEGEKLTYSFKFKNLGKSDLVIASATATCGCTVPDYPRKAIKPGEDGVITVTFNTSGKNGFQHKVVTLAANTQPNTYQLSVKAMVGNPEAAQ